MPKDYKDRVPGSWRGRRHRQRKPWIWLLPVALIAGVAAAILIQHYRSDGIATEAGAGTGAAPSANGPGKGDTAAKSAVPDNGKKKKPDVAKGKKPGKPESPPEIDLPEPRFSFYKILPEKEVIVSEREIMNLQREEKAGKRLAPKGFVIQVGAYSKLEDAEKTRAQLAEAKVKAKMEKVLIENTAWYRVKLGPYETLADAEKVRAQLRKHRIDSVLQQSKPAR